MKKIIIGIGIFLIIALAGVWAYLLFFSTDTADNDLFALFNFGDTTDTSVPLQNLPTLDEEPVVDVTSPGALRQLTTNPTIGHAFVQENASSTRFIYYVEAGTGHVFSINTTTGQEERVSNITISQAQAAVISADGTYAAVSAGTGSLKKITLITLPTDETSLSSVPLSEPGEELFFTSDNELLYLTKNGTDAVAKVYNPESESVRTVFTVPFASASVQWGVTAEATHYVYPRPSSRLQGALYAITAGVIDREPLSGFGFSMVTSGNAVLYSMRDDGEYSTFTTDDGGVSVKLPEVFIPEKCIVLAESTNVFVCAKTQSSGNTLLPDDWLMGDIESRDTIKAIDISTGITTDVVDLYTETNRQFEVSNMLVDDAETGILFINKVDRTLWFYDPTINDVGI